MTNVVDGKVVNMHPSETLSALNSTDRMDMHPVESQSLQASSTSKVYPLHVSVKYFYLSLSPLYLWSMIIFRIKMLVRCHSFPLMSIPTTISSITVIYVMFLSHQKKKVMSTWHRKITKLQWYVYCPLICLSFISTFLYSY